MLQVGPLHLTLGNAVALSVVVAGADALGALAGSSRAWSNQGGCHSWVTPRVCGVCAIMWQAAG